MSRELPLKDVWQSRNATMIEESGWRLPFDFKTFEEEYDTVRNAMGLIDFSWRGKILIKGGDRISFLHNLLTNDIKALAPGQGCQAALLSATGKVMADMNVYVYSDKVLLDVEPGLEKKLIELFNKYIINDDVTLEDATAKITHLALAGPESGTFVQSAFTEPLFDLKERDHFELRLGIVHITLIHQNRCGEMGYDFLIPSEFIAESFERIKHGATFYGMKPAGYGIYEALRIEAGIPRYGKDIDETLSLPETGLVEIAASESKGCYPGQEVVARTKTYGGLNRKLMRLTFDKEKIPAVGDKIYGEVRGEEKEIGRLTSAAKTPKSGVGIALLSKGFFEAEKKIRVHSAEGKIEAETG